MPVETILNGVPFRVGDYTYKLMPLCSKENHTTMLGEDIPDRARSIDAFVGEKHVENLKKEKTRGQIPQALRNAEIIVIFPAWVRNYKWMTAIYLKPNDPIITTYPMDTLWRAKYTRLLQVVEYHGEKK